MNRVIAFIDGFNFYHALEENRCQRLKWINYWSLADAFVLKSQERLTKVYYFSALAHWNQDKARRHRLFIRAQEFYGVEVVLGKFKEVTRNCRICRQQYKTFEEKETDVNIAVYMLAEAAKDSFDKALLFSGDSDMIAGVKAVKTLTPNKHIQAVIPYHRSSIDLTNNCHSSAKVKLKHLQNNQLPDDISLPGGGLLSKPQEWR